MTAETYYSKLRSQYDLAIKATGNIEKTIQIGELTVNMSFAGPALTPTFFKAFDHLESKENSSLNNHIKLFFWDSETTNTDLVTDIPWAQEPRHHLGLIETYTHDDIYTLQQPGSEAIYMFNKKTSEGIYWISSPNKIPYWESDFPLRMIFHWWLIDTPLQPVHAGAIGTAHGGLLLVGKGGSGKSTSTLSCLNSSLKIAGDDYILLDTNHSIAYSLFSLSKLNENSVRLFNHDNLKLDNLPRPIDDKYRIKLYPKFKESLIKQIPIKAILLPEVTQNQETKIEKCSAGQAMLALAPTTLFQLPGLREKSFTKMSSYVRKIPSYKLFLGTTPVYLPDVFRSFLESIETSD